MKKKLLFSLLLLLMTSCTNNTYVNSNKPLEINSNVKTKNISLPIVKTENNKLTFITGNVYDENGNPIEDAHVTAEIIDSLTNTTWKDFSKTDNKGNYLIDNVTIGAKIKIIATKYESNFYNKWIKWTTREQIVIPKLNLENNSSINKYDFGKTNNLYLEKINIPFEKKCSISGKVTDENDNPISNVKIIAKNIKFTESTSTINSLDKYIPYWESEIETNSDGTYFINNVPTEMEIYINASKIEGDYIFSSNTSIVGNDLINNICNLQLNKKYIEKLEDKIKPTITGSVYDKNGNLLDGVKIVAELIDNTNDIWKEETETYNGNYLFTNVPNGKQIKITAFKTEGFNKWTIREQIVIPNLNLEGHSSINKYDFGKTNNLYLRDEPEIIKISINGKEVNKIGKLGQNNSDIENIFNDKFEVEITFNEPVNKNDVQNFFIIESLNNQSYIIDKSKSDISFIWSSDFTLVTIKFEKTLLTSTTTGNEVSYKLYFTQMFRDLAGIKAIDNEYINLGINKIGNFIIFSVINKNI